MKDLTPKNQTNLYLLDDYLISFIKLYEKKKLPNKILLSGYKGTGKSTLAYHLINYILSQNEDFKYDLKNFKINRENHSFKTINNKSCPNLIAIDVEPDKKSIDIYQIRDLILKLNKSNFNNKPRFVLIDNIEYLNLNSVNALLKALEEPSEGVYFIIINNNKKKFPTLFSRCINFKILLTSHKAINIANKLLGFNLIENINTDLINFYFTPGKFLELYTLSDENNIDLKNINLKDLIKFSIKNKLYKKNDRFKILIQELIEFYFSKNFYNIHPNISDKYSYFIKRISDISRYNLDDESFFLEFQSKVLHE